MTGKDIKTLKKMVFFQKKQYLPKPFVYFIVGDERHDWLAVGG